MSDNKPKHPGGRPLLFKTPEELQAKIDAWVESCWEDQIQKDGSIKRVQTIPYTISGLALALDCDMQTITNYGNRDEFFGIIKRAKNMVLNNIEIGALSGKYNPAAAIFNMKANFGMKDNIDVGLGNRDDKPLRITMETVKPLTPIKIDIDPDTAED